MYPILALALAIWLAMLMDGVAGQNRDLTQLYQSRSRQMQVVALAENIEQFYLETAAFPADVTTLSGSTGFQHVRGLADAWQGVCREPDAK